MRNGIAFVRRLVLISDCVSVSEICLFIERVTDYLLVGANGSL